MIASDGVWEFLSNKEVVRIVWPFYDKNQPEAAANKLVKEAFGRWKQNEEVVDDITCVIIFFDEQEEEAPSGSSASAHYPNFTAGAAGAQDSRPN